MYIISNVYCFILYFYTKIYFIYNISSITFMALQCILPIMILFILKMAFYSRNVLLMVNCKQLCVQT